MKIGVVVVTHYRLGEEFLQALRLIVPEVPDFRAVSVDPAQSVDEMRSAIAEAIKVTDRGEGVLVLTDIFGATPHNIAKEVACDGNRTTVLSGLNLSMQLAAGDTDRGAATELRDHDQDRQRHRDPQPQLGAARALDPLLGEGAEGGPEQHDPAQRHPGREHGQHVLEAAGVDASHRIGASPGFILATIQRSERGVNLIFLPLTTAKISC